MAYNNITVETKDFVTVVTLNRPPMNSVNLGVREELNQLVTEVQTSKDTRVVIVTGSGERAFCAGMDVSDVANIDKGSNGIDVCNKVERSLKPFIAVINGHALGGGCELAMACHFRFMTDNPKAQIGCPELNLGQLTQLLKSEYMVNAEPLNKIQGLPFKSSEIENKIESILGEL